MAKANRKRKQRQPDIQRIDVTDERAAKNAFRSMGMARRLIPVIDLLHHEWKVDEERGIARDQRRGIDLLEWEALAYYRDQASLAEKSPVRSCCDTSPRGSGGPGAAIMSALIETGRLDRDLAELKPLVHAIAVNDMSLTQWCIARHGGREKTLRGKVVALVPRGENNGERKIAMARMELRMAAHRIAGSVAV